TQRVNLPAGLGASLAQRFQKPLAILVILKKWPRADPHDSSHDKSRRDTPLVTCAPGRKGENPPTVVNTKNRPLYAPVVNGIADDGADAFVLERLQLTHAVVAFV